MKNLLLLLIGVVMSLSSFSQPPMRPMDGQRPLPNQFRDFVDHQQRWNTQRPKIERKDGQVIITMSEEQFKRMQQMRQVQRMRNVNFLQPPCQNCHRFHGKPHRRKI